MRLLSLSFKVAIKIGNHTVRVIPSRPDLTRQSRAVWFGGDRQHFGPEAALTSPVWRAKAPLELRAPALAG